MRDNELERHLQEIHDNEDNDKRLDVEVLKLKACCRISLLAIISRPDRPDKERDANAPLIRALENAINNRIDNRIDNIIIK